MLHSPSATLNDGEQITSSAFSLTYQGACLAVHVIPDPEGGVTVSVDVADSSVGMEYHVSAERLRSTAHADLKALFTRESLDLAADLWGTIQANL